MIREVGTSIGRAVLDGVGRAASRLQESRSLSADLLESDDAYLAVFDAPGATVPDIGVRFEGGTLSVRIDRFREFHDGYELLLPGRGLALDGEVELPDGAAVDADQAEATLTQEGTLEVLLPKSDDGEGSRTATAAVDATAEPDPGSEPETGAEPDAPEDGPDAPEDGPDAG